MISLFTIDTNILIYSIDRTDPLKHALAKDLVEVLATSGMPLCLQCASEFYRATTRKRLLPAHEAARYVGALLDRVEILACTPSDVLDAMKHHQSSHTPFFDSQLLATAARRGCTTFFSEDMHDGHSFGPLTVRNPFAMPEAELRALLA